MRGVADAGVALLSELRAGLHRVRTPFTGSAPSGTSVWTLSTRSRPGSAPSSENSCTGCSWRLSADRGREHAAAPQFTVMCGPSGGGTPRPLHTVSNQLLIPEPQAAAAARVLVLCQDALRVPLAATPSPAVCCPQPFRKALKRRPFSPPRGIYGNAHPVTTDTTFSKPWFSRCLPISVCRPVPDCPPARASSQNLRSDGWFPGRSCP